MYTTEPKLKFFVDKWNKRNAMIEAKKNQDKVIITHTTIKEIDKNANTKPKRNNRNRRRSL
jgi:hypothetical protein